MDGTSLIGLLLFLGAMTALSIAARRWTHWKAQRVASRLAGVSQVTVFYFWAPSCVQCRTAQKSVVEHLAAQMGPQVRCISINVVEEPDRARAFGVWTVPTTIVLDGEGRVRHVNTGLVDLATLRQQVRRARARRALPGWAELYAQVIP